MSIRYRDSSSTDAQVVADLFAQSFTETFGQLYRPEDLRAFLDQADADTVARELADPTFAFRIAESDDEAVGFAKLGLPSLPVDTPPNTFELRQIYVLPAWQGAGIGPALFDWVVERARERGAEHLQLTVFVENHRAKAFYERRGFIEVGRYDFMVGSQADEDIIMRARL